MQCLWKIAIFVIVSVFFVENIESNANYTRETLYQKQISKKCTINCESSDDFPSFSFTYASLVVKNYEEVRKSMPGQLYQFPDNLQFLDLSGNNIKTLNNEAFANLKEVKFLNLSTNQLVYLPSDVFNNMPSLKYFNLGHNNLTTLPREIFAKNTLLKVISMSKNSFKSLPEGLFENNKNLQTVRIRYASELTKLPNLLFSNLLKLRKVSVSGCNLTSLPEDVFRGSINLREVRIRENDLRSLPAKIFDGLTKLEYLQLDDNRIDSLPDNIFESCINLRRLNLINNSLTTISGFTLIGLESLLFLNMQNNNVTTINETAFESLESVKYINLAQNNITQFGVNLTEDEFITTISHCKNLQELDLSYNNISMIPWDWINNPQIQFLNLSNNALSSLSMYDLDLWRDENFLLDVSYNNITRIRFICEKKFPDNTTIQNITILLHENPLSCNGSVYKLLRYLDGTMKKAMKEKLTIEVGSTKCSDSKYKGVQLTTIKSQDFEYQPTKREIRDYDMCPKICEMWIVRANKTFIFDCSFKKLHTLPSTLCSSKYEGYGIVLNLTGNSIEDISLLPRFSNLTEVFLSQNRISKLKLSMFNIPTLRFVKFDNNRLSKIPDDVVLHLHRENILSTFAKNPWNCKCDNEYLRVSLAYFSHLFIDADDVYCEYNELVKDKEPLCDTRRTTAKVFSIILVVFLLFFGYIGCCMVKDGVWQICLVPHHAHLKKYRSNWKVAEVEVWQEKIYDAFISYAKKDEDFVLEQFLPNLEGLQSDLKLCLHFRDWDIGQWIPNEISRSIIQSKRTIFIISDNFFASEWTKIEFRVALKRSGTEGRNLIIAILYTDIESIEDIDPEFRLYFLMHTYVKWGDQYFWEKLLNGLGRSFETENKSNTQTHAETVETTHL